ncbi:hypothetical protein NPIL_561561 [Nephila pilipes]|uniref:PiggyBac transposable element-derived protein domain-containing protein n=1 Tax=Nephila pilipes TaxID=299642 RepID=A0A8X6MV92_NEPPI|nr:hypothetical protein NPIL_561561 [Nephila pilipes]
MAPVYFYFTMMSLQYLTTQRKHLSLISTMHSNSEVNPTLQSIAKHMTYSSTKGGADSLDELCNSMNCGRKTKRLAMEFFNNIINIAGINADIIYLHTFLQRSNWK